MTDSTAAMTDVHASSQGHELAGTEWLDAHFEAARPEYESILRSVGLRRGWRVLDAGCGSGSFLPLIAAEVGPGGHITALDLAPENVAVVEQRVARWTLDWPVATQVGDLLDLPFADDTFDAVWCANTSQYLSDTELTRALAEFRRVVRPGGMVAIKEADAVIWNIAPGDPGRIWRFLCAARATEPQVHGLLRTPELRRWLQDAGLVEVWQQTTLSERWAPLRPPERQFHTDILAWAARLALRTPLPADDHAFWQMALDPESPEHPINQPDFYAYDAQSVAVGRNPGSLG
jgi:ubiquinone/menaquinone biosynthesis C-methylase UbiE